MSTMICPDCHEALRVRGDEYFPDCENCGYQQLDAWTIAIRDEARREYEQAKRECWPDPVPPYAEYLERGKAKTR